ncbi:class I SAM-dependent RNA methyltransferase [Halovulum dunhuangense]|uniref:Class I SAM-dependent RNA methyltransferase n=1 Tax=Halovulum dunhuangense TaxID=1505036 RepID=A0A849KQZ4_9RHOB|nr:class I SAM-dependent RNA methyltransferase [Halovulum dunhuangense]NNU79289.1 class I SAM-dependent RNA methyltransferase [Halovulum dunhuangense]
MDGIAIERLGHEGDGVGGGGYHPFTLPGETILSGDPPKILTPSPDRVAPVCPHFGRCGGCALQHASDDFLARWKQAVVERALAARGLSAPFRPIAVSPPNSRRRATFAGRRTKKGVQIGFHGRGSDRIEDVTTCALVRPGMLALRPVLEEITRLGASRKGGLRLLVTECDGGWDIDVSGGKPLEGPLAASLAALAGRADLARLSWEGEVVALIRPPAQVMGRARVVPPPGAFLQATPQGEAALVAAVRDAVGDAGRIADLFAGCGTFALPLAERAEVLAVEGDGGMLAALEKGWREAEGLKAVRIETRDLFRRPLEPLELRGFDAVVIDPPRAGCEAQAARLAASRVPVIAAVSCNPVTFARDAQALVAAGYSLDWVQVVDQFRWSGHAELVARLSRTVAG